VTVTFRILSLLLCLLMAGPMSASARAAARPENRVGEFFSSPPKSAAADLDQTLDARWENPACGYDFASGVCKYLYAHGNPINGIDPSGHDLISTIGDLGIRFTLWTMSGSAGATAFGHTVATLNVVAFVSDPGMYLSLGPIGAPEILAADVASLVRAGGKLFSATRSALAARDGFKILAGWRMDMRIPQVGQAGGDDMTTSLLEIHDGMWIGSRFKGRSPNDPTSLHPSLRPNAITRQHAEADAFNQEADAFNQAAWSGTTAEKATLTVDRNLCGACGRSGGVKSMAKALGIKELTVVTPVGTEVIVIDSSVAPATGPITPYGLINAALTAEEGK